MPEPSAPQSIKPPKTYRENETDRFEALTTCGGCGLLAVHRWREPTRKPGMTIYERSREIGNRPDERFSVIRQCECGHEWGQS